jgi:hypothetical protein
LVLHLGVCVARFEEIEEVGDEELVCVGGFSDGNGAEDGAEVLHGQVLDLRVVAPEVVGEPVE